MWILSELKRKRYKGSNEIILINCLGYYDAYSDKSWPLLPTLFDDKWQGVRVFFLSKVKGYGGAQPGHVPVLPGSKSAYRTVLGSQVVTATYRNHWDQLTKPHTQNRQITNRPWSANNGTCFCKHKLQAKWQKMFPRNAVPSDYPRQSWD